MNLLNKNDALSLAKVRLSCYFVQGVSIAFTTERALSGSTDGSEEERKGHRSLSFFAGDLFLIICKMANKRDLAEGKKELTR